jgi:hypothetical protein
MGVDDRLFVATQPGSGVTSPAPLSDPENPEDIFQTADYGILGLNRQDQSEPESIDHAAPMFCQITIHNRHPENNQYTAP